MQRFKEALTGSISHLTKSTDTQELPNEIKVEFIEDPATKPPLTTNKLKAAFNRVTTTLSKPIAIQPSKIAAETPIAVETTHTGSNSLATTLKTRIKISSTQLVTDITTKVKTKLSNRTQVTSLPNLFNQNDLHPAVDALNRLIKNFNDNIF